MAGIVLGISTLKPQMGYLLIPFLLLWAIKQRRFRFVGVFSGTFIFLLGITFVIYPEWLSEWLHRLSVYPSYTLGSPVFLLTQEYLGLGNIAEWATSGILYALVLWSWWMILVKNKNERFMWTLMWTLNITHIVAPRTASPHFVVFLIAVAFFASTWRKVYEKGARWRINLMLFTLFLLPWAHFMLTVGGVNGEQEDPSTHLILPLVMLVIIWFSRKYWWAHAPTIDMVETDEHSPKLAEIEA